MTTVADVAAWLEQLAPARLAESGDNVGLLWGDPTAAVERVMTCLTVTPSTVSEAVSDRVALIVSHHPVLFRAVKQIRADLPESGPLWTLARAGVSVVSHHTAYDNATLGINDLLCRRLGLVELSALRPVSLDRNPTAIAGSPEDPSSFKVVVFTPESDREAVLAGAFEAGAGHIGAYRECSFATFGEGTFFGTEATDPAVGQRGRRETVQELRLEVICPADRLAEVLEAVRSRHSYEEPAIDVYPLREAGAPARSHAGPGAGRIGRYLESRTLAEFASLVGRTLGAADARSVGDPGRLIHRVAVACGAGDDFLKDAARAGADVLLTGEARFHRGIEAEALGIALVTAGHFATERLGVEDLAQRIAVGFPDVTVWPSRSERDPFRALGALATDMSEPAGKLER
jgi:dinuclear metal center YbgI/SA1388 family protein